jgi:hypothetical protein
MRSLACSSAEVLGLFCAPHVGFGFWLGFALCCVALLCAVCVRLRLVLFPRPLPRSRLRHDTLLFHNAFQRVLERFLARPRTAPPQVDIR